MTLFQNKYRVESTRKNDWDYNHPGLYFITICTKDKINYFGSIADDVVILSDLGKIARQCLIDIPVHFQKTQIDEYVIMPDHVHFIVEILHMKKEVDGEIYTRETQGFKHGEQEEMQNLTTIEMQNLVKRETQNLASLQQTPHQNQFGPQSKNLASIIRGYKIGVKKWAAMNNVEFFWQAGYYDKIIKTDLSLLSIRQYIQQNPVNWENDEYR